MLTLTILAKFQGCSFNPPLARSESSGRSPAAFIERSMWELSRGSTDIIPGGPENTALLLLRKDGWSAESSACYIIIYIYYILYYCSNILFLFMFDYLLHYMDLLGSKDMNLSDIFENKVKVLQRDQKGCVEWGTTACFIIYYIEYGLAYLHIFECMEFGVA